MFELNHQVTYKTCDQKNCNSPNNNDTTFGTLQVAVEIVISYYRDCYKLLFITNLWPGHTEKIFCNTLTHRNNGHKQSNQYDDRFNMFFEVSAEWNRAVQTVV